MAFSYYAKYNSTDGKTLIGGVTSSRSSRYQTREMAQAYADNVVSLHAPGRVSYTIEDSNLYPEIFTHCGRYASSIGSNCPGCRKLLTVLDAKQSVGFRE